MLGVGLPGCTFARVGGVGGGAGSELVARGGIWPDLWGMHSTSPLSQGPDHPVNYWGFGPRTSAVLAASGLVCTAFGLGSDWLGAGFAGLPLGAWVVASAGVGAHFWAGGRLRLGVVSQLLGHRSTIGRSIPTARTRFVLSEEVAEAAGRQAGLGLARVGGTLQRATARIVRGTAAHTVSIGVDATDADYAAIVAAIGVTKPGGAEIDVVRANAGLIKDGPEDVRKFDALLRRTADGEFYLFVPETDAQPAAVEDWTQPGAIGYSSCFPIRLDTARVDLGEVDLGEASMGELVAAMTTVFAVLGRSPARVVGGSGVSAALGGRTTLANFAAVLEAAMDHLADTLSTVRHVGQNTKPRAMAARVLMAAQATRGSQRSGVDRAELARGMAELLGQEPEAMLRLGAIQVACGQDDAALETFATACREIRGLNVRCATDPMVYVMSESDLGQPDALTLGRIAAGVTLMYATAAENTMTYLRDDLIEDLVATKRFAHDADGMMLMRNLTERLCRAAQPAKAAAGGAGGAGTRARKRRKAA